MSSEVGTHPDEVAAAVERQGVAPMAAAAAFSASHGEVGGARGTYFDLASVTKPVLAIAVARSGLSPETPLRALLPEVEGTDAADIPLELCLAHRAGLLAHAPLYAPLLAGCAPVSRADALRTAATRRADAVPLPDGEGWTPVYSDLGYLLAGEALAAYLGARDAGEAILELVARPLGLLDALGTARDLEARGIPLVELAAPTEDVPWRGGLVRGRVHDENAWALGGAGGCGHAGLFGTIDAVVALGRAILGAVLGTTAPPLVPADALRWMLRERPGSTLRAGFDGKSPEGSSAGSVLGPRTFGHLGFTGTSLWIDPEAGVGVALLTNRVSPTRANDRIRAARPRAHDALARRALANSRGGVNPATLPSR
jgi:CubicO group peptidase (beta-lactamase class C family)